MSTLTIRLDAELEADLERIARARHRTKSDLVREVLRRYTTRELYQEARDRLRPCAEEAGYLTDEDFFREFS
jgi:predicted transcriptional regulator